MSFLDTTPAGSIYPALPTGQYPSTAVYASMLTQDTAQQTMYAYVSSVNAANGPGAPKVQFTSYQDYINYKLASNKNGADPNRAF
jgi:hypothetical protein